MFAHSRTETQETDIVLTLTPHIVRVLNLTEDDLRPFRVGRDAGAPVLDVPVPIEIPVPVPRDGPPPAAPGTDSAQPIRPPVPQAPDPDR
jgi:general secretion pathway protein D